jgi:hypothetical protein
MIRMFGRTFLFKELVTCATFCILEKYWLLDYYGVGLKHLAGTFSPFAYAV